jgi:hypothetical protein
MLPLRRSSEYKARVRWYASVLAERYRLEIADVFLTNVKASEGRIRHNNHIGTDAPYLLAGQNVILTKLYFDSGPAKYCLIYEVTSDYVGLISLSHGIGSRCTDTLARIWSREGRNTQ